MWPIIGRFTPASSCLQIEDRKRQGEEVIERKEQEMVSIKQKLEGMPENDGWEYISQSIALTRD